jgi:hypothetical protein
MNCEAVDGCLAAAEPLCVNCDPPEGFPNINCLEGGGDGDLLNKLFVLENRFAGAEPMRLNSDGLLGFVGVTELTGRIGLLFHSGTTVVPPALEEALLLYFDDPSALCKVADDPGVAVPFDEPVDEPDVESLAASLELCFEAKGFKLLNQPACAGEIAISITPSTRESRPMAFTDPTPCGAARSHDSKENFRRDEPATQMRRSGSLAKLGRSVQGNFLGPGGPERNYS